MRTVPVLLLLLFMCCSCAVAEAPTENAEGTLTRSPDTRDLRPRAGIDAEQSESPPAWTFPLSEEIIMDEADYLVLANVDSKLASDYAPKDLINIKVRKSVSETMKMRKAASDALDMMFKDALDEDNVKLYAHSCYRSYDTQKIMYANRLARVGYDDKLVQQAGASDHQTGLGIDVIGASWLGKERLNDGIADTKEGKWVLEHCAEYGFIIRYPKDMEHITGIKYEPWHLRYVGVEAAAYITDNGLTLEEFSIIRENLLNGTYVENESETTVIQIDPSVVLDDDGFEDLG
ncbi:MAG: M15 family metallopeptidase [Oscillospiraceae bacterium]|jgi:LAS superfamily LD-carboxypeptidase LdcB|nr:M15 family metallopeptidase [Oscillospiraceae bacterium]